MSSEDVSVIIPTHKRPRLLVRAVESAQTQTHPPLEIIIIFEKQEDIPDDWVSCPPDSVRMYKNTGSGVSAARNTGIKKVRSQFLAFLDDDDVWLPTKIERHLEKMDNTDAQPIATYSGVQQRDNNNQLNALKTPEVTYRNMLTGNHIGTFSTLLVRRSAINEVGMLDESLSCWEDWDYYLRLLKQGRVQAVSEPLVLRYSGHNQLSDAYQPKIDAAEYLISKHIQGAKRCSNGSQIFKSGVKIELGKSATQAGKYAAARSHFCQACKIMPRNYVPWLRLMTVIGGQYTFIPVQKMKQIVVRARN